MQQRRLIHYRPKMISYPHRPHWAFLFVVALIASNVASADRLRSTREQQIVEHDHVVEIDVYDGYAIYKVKRSFSTTGARSEQVELDIELPEGATASHLAILAQGEWHKAELLEQAEARRKYERLTGFGVAPVKDPAILYWQGSSMLGLQIFPIQKKKTWLEYHLVVPGRFEKKRIAYDYPKVAALEPEAKGVEAHQFSPIRLSVSNVESSASLNKNDMRLDAKKISIKQKRTLKRIKHHENKRDDASSTLTLAKAKPFQLASHFAKIDLATDREAIWADINVGRLSAAPKNAKVVFVFDASISVGEGGLYRQTQVARATASHFPKNTRFSALTFSRKAEKQSPFVSHLEFQNVLKRVQNLPRNNGSEITKGIAKAAKMLAAHQGEKRIILLSDNRRRLTTPEDELQRVLGKEGALLHIVEVPSHRKDEQTRSRRRQQTRMREIEKSFWSKGVQKNGGIVVRLDSHDWKSKDLREETLHLMRPTKIKDLHFKRAKKGRSTFRMAKEDSMRMRELPDVGEGEQLRMGFGTDKNEVAPVLKGRLWSKPVSWEMKTSPAYSKASGGFLISLGRTEWTPFETMTLAQHSHVVSPVTSLIAAEPGARPSRDGFGRGGGSLGGRGFGSGGGGTASIRTSQMVMTSWNQILTKERDACMRAHKGGREWTFYFVLQRGLLEIVDVQPLRNPSQKVSALENCLYEAIWNYRLRGNEPEPDIVFLSAR